jgi:hypothetical protein
LEHAVRGEGYGQHTHIPVRVTILRVSKEMSIEVQVLTVQPGRALRRRSGKHPE